MENISILWVDDEIDMLRSQIIFLEDKGYLIETVANGQDALAMCTGKEYDIVFLDEHMPGLSGLETLSRMKEIRPRTPVVMITKNEEENIMDEALGSQIADYLIKPVKPNQILLTIKKLMDNERLVREKTTSDYRQEFQKIFQAFGSDMSPAEWADLYGKVVSWELKLHESSDTSMAEVLRLQKTEANVEFFKFISRNYKHWLQDPESAPVMSNTLLSEKVFPLLDEGKPLILVIIDNLRLDQWKVIEPVVAGYFRTVKDETYYSVLPTATQYSRNAIFAGLMPLEIEQQYPGLWKNDADEGGKNLSEDVLLAEQMKNAGLEPNFEYIKVTNNQAGKYLEDNIRNLLHKPFIVIVYNFIDMLSHARTEMEVLKELAGDEAAYRSVTVSWFEHSPLLSSLKKISSTDVNIVISTDHGSIRVKQPSKVVGDKNTTTNLRFKQGKNLSYNEKEVLEYRHPHDIYLPMQNVSSAYIFAREDKFFVYPNNYNYYVNYFRDTFQHGGVSLEEMIIPVATLKSK